MIARRAAIVAVTVCVGVALLAGCADAPHPKMSMSTSPSARSTPKSVPDANAQAHTMLAAAVLPPGAKPTKTPAAPGLDQPAQRPACTPLVDVSRSWRVDDTALDAVSEFITEHPTPGLRYQGSGHLAGSAGVSSMDIVEAKPGQTPIRSTLVFTLATVSDGVIGV